MIITDKGLDLNFKETKKSLNIIHKDIHSLFLEDVSFERIKNSLKEIDFKQFLTRFKWHNLPKGLDSELLEKILYYTGSAMFFYIEALDQFLFLPYAMSGDGVAEGIDFYGRFEKLQPYSFNGTTHKSIRDGDKKIGKNAKDMLLSTQIRNNIVDIPFVSTKEEAEEIYKNGAVICWDSSFGLAYANTSRSVESKPYLDYMKQILIQTESALINSSGFNMFATKSQGASALMQSQLEAIDQDRKKGLRAAAVSSELGEITNLQSNNTAAIADFWTALQSADNLRLKSLGISNDGVIQKTQYQNIQEQSLDINDSMQVYMNAFMERIKFAAIVNSIWGLGIYPEPLLMPGTGEKEDVDQLDEKDSQQAQEGTNA